MQILEKTIEALEQALGGRMFLLLTDGFQPGVLC